jgi:glycosyltransferase involved in cell wall biosynthesis
MNPEPKQYRTDGPKPLVSVIMCTRDRADKLQHCLECIERMHASFEWELLLVDNASTDDTPNIIQRFAENFSAPCFCLYSSAPGSGAGRNVAIAASRGDILAFVDDDCYVAADFIANIEMLFRDPTLGYMSGRMYLYDPTDYPLTINESPHRLIFDAGKIPSAGVIQGGNMAVRRTALDSAAGWFDPDFGAGAKFSGDDWELAMRISAAGWSGGYFPEPAVWHHHGRKAHEAARKYRYYGLGEGAIYAKGMLNSKLRRKVIGRWIKSAGGDLVKRRSYRHMYHVICGGIKYWNFCLKRRFPALAKNV